MDNELTRQSGRYWVLFFQPLPEAGERIAIALVFEPEKKGAFIEYDPVFAKVAKVYPDADPLALAFCLESLRNELHASDQVDLVLQSYGSQISSSVARRIAKPVTRAAVEMLMARYVYPAPAKRAKRDQQRVDSVGREIEAFVRTSIGSDLGLQTDVAAREIFGRSVAGTKKVAVAISSQSGWTLIDGVDLNQLSPLEAEKRADQITHTFWSYSRVAHERGVRLQQVGVVLNGSSHLAPKAHEAHDYALHRFTVDSDLAIDAASTESGRQLRELVARAGGK